MSPSAKPRYAIIGGGIAGATLAIALHKRGLDVKIYEQAHKFGEIGAGVAFTKNAIEAMTICDPGIHNAFLKVATHNQWDDKKDVWFDFLNGTLDKKGHQEAEFQIKSPVGMNGVHRARYLEEMVRLVEHEDLAVFGKHLDTIQQSEDGKLEMRFHDGSVEEADAVIGCDGIKSQVRRVIVGEDSPMAKHVYTHKYAYRGLIEMEKAIEAVGEERAMNSVVWMGPNRHVLTFPVEHGKTLNLVAFVTTERDWPDYTRSTLPAKREEAIKDFQGFGPNVLKLLELTKPDLDTWAIMDLGDHPLEKYNQGKICVVGDAAHATSPHHGAGAGFCIEDAAVLATLLANPAVTGRDRTIEAAFETFSRVRKQRTEWLVQSSRHQGDLYEWRDPKIGKNFDRIEQEIMARNFFVEGVDVHTLCEEATRELQKRLETSS